MNKPFKQPVSVLVVLYREPGSVLLLERADKAGFWQSVTGSREGDEALGVTACREVAEETGLDLGLDVLEDWQQQNRYEIYPHWRHRYAPGVTENTEHVFSFEVPANATIRLAPGEHLAYHWLPWQIAAAQVFSPSNAEAIIRLAQRKAWT